MPAAPVITVLLLLFGVVSYSAALSKNATVDEPGHTLSGYLELTHGDFRLETQNPSLWKCWAAVGNVFWHPTLSFNAPPWTSNRWSEPAALQWTIHSMYQTPTNDGAAAVNRARFMMLLLSLGLGVTLALWAYQLAGPVAAIVATACFSLDPTFLAHGSLVKSDVPSALAFFGFALAAQKLMKRATPLRILCVALLAAVSISVKFSGVLAGPVLIALLILRSLHRDAWPVLGRLLVTRIGRLVASATLCIAVAVFCWAFTWGCYAFRFAPSGSGEGSIDLATLRATVLRQETAARLHRVPSPSELAAHQPSAVIRFVEVADAHHFLPHAMLCGFLNQYGCNRMWPAFLDNQLYGIGRWDFFPRAFVYKTPVATLAALALAILGLSVRSIRSRSSRIDGFNLAMVIPPLIFLAAALAGNLNIGLRNLLPVFPFLFLWIGIGAAAAYRSRPRLTSAAIVFLFVCTALETLPAWPDYIPFFNVIARTTTADRTPRALKTQFDPSNGPITLLGDSNLDWGQDLNALADWQKAHPGIPIYLRYYGTVDPASLGVVTHPLNIAATPTGPVLQSDIPMAPGVIAISASFLQGLWLDPRDKPFCDFLLHARRPRLILHHSIYLYDFPFLPQPPEEQRR